MKSLCIHKQDMAVCSNSATTWALRRIGVCLALGCLMVATPASAQSSSALTAVYGRGVHAYFAGNSTQAEQYFTEVIQAGSSDPRPYYFRAILRLGQGRQFEAENDMRIGATYEARNPGVQHSIGRALQRVQGPSRRTLEQFRRQARLDRVQQGRQQTLQRYEQLRQRAPNVLRQESTLPLNQPVQPPQLPQAGSALEVPGSGTKQAPAGAVPQPMPTQNLATPQSAAPTPAQAAPLGSDTKTEAADPFGAPAPVTPEDDDLFGSDVESTTPAPAPAAAEADPFGELPAPAPSEDDPFGASPAAEEMTEPAATQDDIFGESAEPAAADDDPFGESEDTAPSNDDPFGESEDAAPAGDDPFGESEEAAPAGDDPFGESEDAAPSDDDPFGESTDADMESQDAVDEAPADEPPADDDPFGESSSEEDDPFGESSSESEDDPFGESSSESGDDPFGEDSDAGDDPFGEDSDAGEDPFGEEMDDDSGSSDEESSGSDEEADDPFGPLGGAAPTTGQSTLVAKPTITPTSNAANATSGGQLFFALGQWLGSRGSGVTGPQQGDPSIAMADFQLGPTESNSASPASAELDAEDDPFGQASTSSSNSPAGEDPFADDPFAEDPFATE